MGTTAPELEMQIIAPEAVNQLIREAARIADAHRIPFKALGPVLMALGEELRQAYACKMRESGYSEDDVANYLAAQCATFKTPAKAAD